MNKSCLFHTYLWFFVFKITPFCLHCEFVSILDFKILETLKTRADERRKRVGGLEKLPVLFFVSYFFSFQNERIIQNNALFWASIFKNSSFLSLWSCDHDSICFQVSNFNHHFDTCINGRDCSIWTTISSPNEPVYSRWRSKFICKNGRKSETIIRLLQPNSMASLVIWWDVETQSIKCIKTNPDELLP